MRITAKQFALSLYESVADPLRPRSEASKPAGEVKVVIKKFVELLAKKHRLAMAERVIKEFEIIWNGKNDITEAEVTSAVGLDKEIIKSLKTYIANISGAKKVLVNEKVDSKLLGGVVIKYGDKVLDGSLKAVLGDLKEKLVK